MKAPSRWLDDPNGLPDELRASMEAYRQLGPSEPERAQIRVGVRTGVANGPALLRGLGLLSALAGLGGLGWSMRMEPAVAPAVAPVSEPRQEVPPEEPSVVQPASSEQAVAPAPRRVVRVKRQAVAPTAAQHTVADPAAELALLRRARRLLASDPGAALALTDEHLQAYPTGVFAQERELLAIEALSQRDRPAAIARARSFANMYPRSVHRARIEAALGAH